ncbi:hypothetical protein QCA50_020059 [Cerrena zonata]|uniref:Cytochrome P450 n=1 Tax=Cerrena zonata TaxID=2478898 RepID=A0AAW0FA26_9APHY
MTVVQVLAVLIGGWIIWQFLRNYLIRSPLDNVPGPKPNSWFKGNIGQLFDRYGWKFQDELQEKYGSVLKLQSIFGRKALFVYDPRALQSIIIKDQYIYEPADWNTSSFSLMFGPGILATYGERHRKQRKMLNPVFSIKHMRHMTPIFYQVAQRMREGIRNHVKHAPGEIDLLRWIHRTALELIGQGGLGHSFDSLEDDAPYAEYPNAIKQLIVAMLNTTVYRMMIPYFQGLGPKWFRRWLLNKVPIHDIQRMKELVDVMDEHTQRIFFGKRTALEAGDAAVKEQVAKGKDIMSILLRENLNACDDDKLSEEELLGQMSILVFAATDTTTSALTQIFHIIAQHQDAQDKLRVEIMAAKDEAGGDIPHDELMSLPYLDAVCRETLRLYPPVSIITRETRKDIVMPLSKPILGLNGKMMPEIPVPKGTNILIGIRASNLNPDVWGEDVREWKPERWLKGLPQSVSDAHIPGVYSNL